MMSHLTCGCRAIAANDFLKNLASTDSFVCLVLSLVMHCQACNAAIFTYCLLRGLVFSE